MCLIRQQSKVSPWSWHGPVLNASGQVMQGLPVDNVYNVMSGKPVYPSVNGPAQRQCRTMEESQWRGNVQAIKSLSM